MFPYGSQQLSTFGNIVQCIVPLVANAFLLLNAGTPYWRRNIFWMLLALSCTLWMLGEFDWTYLEVYKHESAPVMYGADIVFFLKGIPMMAALALQPHRRQAELQLRLGYLDFVSFSRGGASSTSLLCSPGCMRSLRKRSTTSTTT